MYDKGQVLKDYQQGKDQYLVIKEGQKIVKYRLYEYSAGMAGYGTLSEAVHSVDPITEVCNTGTQLQTAVDCQKLKKDADLASYITW